MKEHRIKLGDNITVRIEADDRERCLETCPFFKNGFDGVCKTPNRSLVPLSDYYIRSIKCIKLEM